MGAELKETGLTPYHLPPTLATQPLSLISQGMDAIELHSVRRYVSY